MGYEQLFGRYLEREHYSARCLEKDLQPVELRYKLREKPEYSTLFGEYIYTEPLKYEPIMPLPFNTRLKELFYKYYGFVKQEWLKPDDAGIRAIILWMLDQEDEERLNQDWDEALEEQRARMLYCEVAEVAVA